MARDQLTRQADIMLEIEEDVKKLQADFLALEIEHMRKGTMEARKALARVRKAFTEKRDEVRGALDRLGRATGAARQEAREGVEAAWNALGEAFERAKGELGGEED